MVCTQRKHDAEGLLLDWISHGRFLGVTWIKTNQGAIYLYELGAPGRDTLLLNSGTHGCWTLCLRNFTIICPINSVQLHMRKSTDICVRAQISVGGSGRTGHKNSFWSTVGGGGWNMSLMRYIWMTLSAVFLQQQKRYPSFNVPICAVGTADKLHWLFKAPDSSTGSAAISCWLMFCILQHIRRSHTDPYSKIVWHEEDVPIK